MSTFARVVNRSVENILTSALRGECPIKLGGNKETNLFGDGISITLGENKVSSSSPKTRNVVSMSPVATILIKKKAFSTFKHVNDLQWMDRTEKMLLRATKALFAYKVAQLRAYESLNKVTSSFEETKELNLNLFAELLHNAKFLNVPKDQVTVSNTEALSLITSAVSSSLADLPYDDLKEDVLKLIKRQAFSNDNQFTTWIVDPDSVENFGTGPGTGVIELGLFSRLSCGTDLSSDPTPADFSFEDPYRISNVTTEDIEVAIDEALLGTIGLLDELGGENLEPSVIDTRSIISASIEQLGFGNLDPSLDLHYIRDSLRKFYLGKPFISAGDAVHIFIRGNKTVQDFSKDTPFQREDLSIDETILEAERILFTNKKIDFNTYKRLREFSDNSLAMKHVYGGYVEQTNTSWGGGKWTVQVSCTDNMGWLKWSRFMIEPALQDPQGILEDPLTPYEIRRDASGRVLSASGPELIAENKELLRSGLLSYDSGILNGQVATENNLLQGQYNQGGSFSNSKVLQHPNGFVYRWKTGILTATADIETEDPLNEGLTTFKSVSQHYGLTVAEDVLNNLDVANILSLLIVGQPYNVETFVDQAYRAHNIGSRDSSASLSPEDPLASVLDVVRRQNVRFGNFKPYRLITMSNSTIEQTASSNVIRNEINVKIKQLRDRRTKLFGLASKLDQNSVTEQPLRRTLLAEISSIDASIQDQIDAAKNSGDVSSVDLLTTNFNLFGRNRALPLSGNFQADHEITRAMMSVGAQRRIEDVRLNRDQNLFIVSDQYDEHTDIRPYLFALKNSEYNIFRGTFVDIHSKCKAASGFMNLEFFCNPQGHLEFRPPQWNRTPLSVLEDLFTLTKETGQQIIPEFLRDIFETRSSSLRKEVHTLNVKIVLLALLLGKFPDGSLIPNFPDPSKNIFLVQGSDKRGISLGFFGVRIGGIKGKKQNARTLRQGRREMTGTGSLVDTGDQIFGQGLKLAAIPGEDGDVLGGDTETVLGVFDPIFQEEQGITAGVLTKADNNESFPAREFATSSNLNQIRNDFRRIAGADPASEIIGSTDSFSNADFVFFNQSTRSTETITKANKVNKYLDLLQQTISERDRIVTILARNREKQKELEEIETILSGEFTGDTGLDPDRDDDLANAQRGGEIILEGVKTITDILSGDATKGSLFDHLVEDDSRNLLGPGSGKRYIVQEHDIISCNFMEKPPDFCRVDIVGNAPIIGAELQQQYSNRYFWAGATDYDLWRQYGYKSSGDINLPFASNAELQCRPFAYLELQLQRVKINQGTLTVVGNEYYAPGDVIFIPEKGLLYYVRSVKHDFQFGGQFTTTLILENGHPPGQYLPSPLDIIGQQLTKDPLSGGTVRVYRNQKGDDNYRVLQPDSCLRFPDRPRISRDNLAALLDHKGNQLRYTNMMINLNSVSVGSRKVLIRGFVRNDSEEDLEKVRNNIAAVRSLLENPIQITQGSPNSLGDDFLDTLGGAARFIGVGTGSTKGTTSMSLPNGLPVQPISPESIVEQIVIMNKRNETSQIECLNIPPRSNQSSGDREVDVISFESAFPKGGPKQKTWLDIRGNPLTQVSNVIEVGILDINRSIKTSKRTNS
jgi:hypothetical protein